MRLCACNLFKLVAAVGPHSHPFPCRGRVTVSMSVHIVIHGSPLRVGTPGLWRVPPLHPGLLVEAWVSGSGGGEGGVGVKLQGVVARCKLSTRV